DDALGEAPQALLLLAPKRAAGVDDDRRRRLAVPLGDLLQQRVAAAVGQREVGHHAVEARAGQRLARLVRAADGLDGQALARQQFAQVVAQLGVVLDDQQALAVAPPARFQLAQRAAQHLARGRLAQV